MARARSVKPVVDPLVYSIADAADALRTSKDTVRRMIASDELEAHKLRAQWRIPKAAVDALVHDGHATKPTKRAAAKTTKATTKRAAAKTTTKRTTKTTKPRR
jgi:excisionase family DNA binding protein